MVTSCEFITIIIIWVERHALLDIGPPKVCHPDRFCAIHIYRVHRAASYLSRIWFYRVEIEIHYSRTFAPIDHLFSVLCGTLFTFIRVIIVNAFVFFSKSQNVIIHRIEICKWPPLKTPNCYLICQTKLIFHDTNWRELGLLALH